MSFVYQLFLYVLGWVQNEDRRSKTQKQRPRQNFEITQKRLKHDSRSKQKQGASRFAVINEFDQSLHFVHNPTKSTKQKPRQNRLEIT